MMAQKRSKRSSRGQDVIVDDRLKSVAEWSNLDRNSLVLKCMQYSLVDRGNKATLSHRLYDFFHPVNTTVDTNTINTATPPTMNVSPNIITSTATDHLPTPNPTAVPSDLLQQTLNAIQEKMDIIHTPGYFKYERSENNSPSIISTITIYRSFFAYYDCTYY